MYSSLQRHNIVLIVVLLTLLFSLTYFRHAAYQIDRPLSSVLQQSPEELQQQQPIISPPPPPSSALSTLANETTACDKVDFSWLASDRTHWDGWASKAMFMRPDGKYTSRNFTIEAGDSLCAVVLLGPIPAVGAIRPETHFAPADSITIQAVGDHVLIPVTLQQHHKQSNVYYSAVHFAHPDTYRLESTTEYRSYFWEAPIYHAHRPFHYTSHHRVTVNAPPIIDQTQSYCDTTHATAGSWINKTMDDMVDSDFLIYTPDTCQLRDITPSEAAQCLEAKNVHVVGDIHVRRNMRSFATGEDCSVVDENDKCGYTEDELVLDAATTGWPANTDVQYLIMDHSIGMDGHWRDVLQQEDIPRADVVIVGVGNHDIEQNRLTPRQYWHAFTEFLIHLMTKVYPTQTIIVRTPQYFCCGTIHGTSWNAGRSHAFANVMRHAVQHMASERIVLWDTHRLGINAHVCPGTTQSPCNVVNTENLLLSNILCSSSSS